MQLNFTNKNFELTPSIKHHINSKFSYLEKHYHHLYKVHVILRKERNTQIAEANIHVNHKDINAIAKNRDLYAAVDILVSKLNSQLAKYKNKRQYKRHDQASINDTK